MYCIDNPYTDPYFNLAAEEYLFRERRENFFMLWRSTPSVVIGKHQDATRELDGEAAAARGVRLVRRLTGGGAVYHDLGNFNLTFIGDCRLVRADRLTEAIAAFLRSLGLPVRSDERRNLWIDGKKISGSAQSIRKERCIHHATLLFASDLETLRAVLRPAGGVAEKRSPEPLRTDDPRPAERQTAGQWPDTYRPDTAGCPDRRTGNDEPPACERTQANAPGQTIATDAPSFSVESVRSPVTNICEHLLRPLTLGEFRRNLFAFGSSLLTPGEPYLFAPRDLAAIGYLKTNKYATYLWNYRVRSSYRLPVPNVYP